MRGRPCPVDSREWRSDAPLPGPRRHRRRRDSRHRLPSASPSTVPPSTEPTDDDRSPACRDSPTTPECQAPCPCRNWSSPFRRPRAGRRADLKPSEPARAPAAGLPPRRVDRGHRVQNQTLRVQRKGHARASFRSRPHRVLGEAALDAGRPACPRRLERALPGHARGGRAFVRAEGRAVAKVVVSVGVSCRPLGLQGIHGGEASLAGVIEVPVRVVVIEPAARGQTSRETLLYQVVATLGHALGSARRRPRYHVLRPGSVDLGDAAVREAYVQARRRPDLGSARAQLAPRTTSASGRSARSAGRPPATSRCCGRLLSSLLEAWSRRRQSGGLR